MTALKRQAIHVFSWMVVGFLPVLAFGQFPNSPGAAGGNRGAMGDFLEAERLAEQDVRRSPGSPTIPAVFGIGFQASRLGRCQVGTPTALLAHATLDRQFHRTR